jgi:hypothetical protein
MVSCGNGLIRLGDVTSYGDWQIVTGCLEILFDIRSLTLEHQRVLMQYQAWSGPLEFRLPDDQRSTKSRILGFERRQRQSVFYISRDIGKTSSSIAPLQRSA